MTCNVFHDERKLYLSRIGSDRFYRLSPIAYRLLSGRRRDFGGARGKHLVAVVVQPPCLPTHPGALAVSVTTVPGDSPAEF